MVTTKTFEATEQAYKNGYEQGKKDALKWIPVSERLPEYGQEVIVYIGNVLKPFIMTYTFWNPEYDTWAHVTHWMLLPEPPKGE